MFRAIQTRDDGQAAEIFKRIRNGADPESILRQLTASDLLLQLHMVPETRLRYDFPHATEMPSYLQGFDNPYLHSQIYEGTFNGPTFLSGAPPASSDIRSPVQYLKPYRAATLIEPRIDQARPSLWTKVSTDDTMMRAILRAYFQFEYPFCSFFHKDHFLDGLISGKGLGCSTLLVNAVLAAGCVSSVPTIYHHYYERLLHYPLRESIRAYFVDT